MKKFISAVVLASLVLSSLAGCMADGGAKKSVTASEGTDKYATLLEERLTVMPDSLVIATGEDAEKYGVDTDSFVDNEGYTIRATDGDVVILAKTDAGIDRAVRQFAAYGNNEYYTFTYGEGYRVKKLTVNGNDISEYAAVCPDDADECMLYAVKEFTKYVKLACGTEIPEYSASDYSASEEKPARTITFSIDYPALGDEAFTINVKDDGNIDILCGRYRGGLYGAYDLLGDIGWRFLADGTEYLYEAGAVDITSAVNRTEEPAIANRFASAYPINYDISYGAKLKYHGRYLNKATTSKFGFYGIVAEACHGLDTHNIDWKGTYAGFKATNTQPCFTDEDVLDVILEHYRSYIDTAIASGAVIGKDLCYIDAAQFDTTSFCTCTSCTKVVSEEGSVCGPILRMTNMIADMAAEYSPDISVLMLAYAGTNKPPRKTVPRENVKISYCFYTGNGITCSNHNITGEDCVSGGYTNKGFYEEFEGWKKICPADNLQVWYYPLNCYELAFQAPGYDVAFDDIKHLIDSDIDCLMLCEGDNNDCILLSAIAELAWNGDMTEEEYYALLEEYFRILYGEKSGEYIYEYANIILRAGDLTECFCSFHSDMTDKVDNDFIASRFDYMVALFDDALRYAETEEIYKRIEVLRARMLYMGITIVHEERYTNGTEKEREEIAELYSEMHSVFLRYKLFVFNDYITSLYAPAEFDVTKNPSEHWCVLPE